MRFNDCDRCAGGITQYDGARIEMIDGYAGSTFFGDLTATDVQRQARLDDATQLKAKLQFINDKLYAALPNPLRFWTRGDVEPIVTQWHDRALEWMNEMGGVVADNAAYAAWVRRGEKLSDGAAEINQKLEDYSVGKAISEFGAQAESSLLKFPAKLAMSLALPVVIILGALAGGLYLVKRSGLTGSVSIPGLPVSAGLRGFNGYWSTQHRKRRR